MESQPYDNTCSHSKCIISVLIRDFEARPCYWLNARTGKSNTNGKLFSQM